MTLVAPYHIPRTQAVHAEKEVWDVAYHTLVPQKLEVSEWCLFQRVTTPKSRGPKGKWHEEGMLPVPVPAKTRCANYRKQTEHDEAPL